MPMDRRTLLMVAAVAALMPADARAQTIAERLLAQGPLPELALGNPQAPVTMIEYLSLTCHHCENFHKTAWPEIKAKYVDTGKVRYVLREFPLETAAMAGFMLARCSGEKWYATVDLLFGTANDWAHAENKLEALARIMRQTGMERPAVDACFADRKLMSEIDSVRLHAQRAFNVRSTPTFFINGLQHVGVPPMEKLTFIIETLLGN
jgi:protein-disulfide isomerase